MLNFITFKGRTFGGLIKSFLDRFHILQKELLPAYETKQGFNNYSTSLAVAEQNFPQYVTEIRGMADGANVPFHHVSTYFGVRYTIRNKCYPKS